MSADGDCPSKSAGDAIDAGDIPAGLGLSLGETLPASAEGALVLPYAKRKLQDFKDTAERAYLVANLRKNDWNIAATAKAIETPRSNLYKKLEAHDINREKDGEPS